MKVKVINIKDICKYLVKIGIGFAVIAIFTNFFYSNKNVTGSIRLDSTKFIATLQKEIILLKNQNQQNINIMSKSDYAKQTFNNEISMMKIVNEHSNENSINVANTNGVTSNENQSVQTQENAKDSNKVDEGAQNEVESVNSNLEEPQTGVAVEVMPSNVPNKYTYEVLGVQIRNESDYNITEEIKDVNTDFNKQDVMIFHTHTCESYTETEQYSYNETGTFRTTDLNFTVARVGDELEKCLKNYGYSVVHDKTYHDYPAYTGSYDRSLVTVKNLLAQYTNTDVVIDLHRDAIGDNTYAPKVKIGDEYCARLMFVIGTDGGGLTHKNWRENLKFAIKLQQKANELYPGLFKPIIVRNSRYNHQLSSAACIIEVGATGNTLEECLNSMKYFGKIFHEM